MNLVNQKIIIQTVEHYMKVIIQQIQTQELIWFFITIITKWVNMMFHLIKQIFSSFGLQLDLN
jgi:hypothetical protein